MPTISTTTRGHSSNTSANSTRNSHLSLLYRCTGSRLLCLCYTFCDFYATLLCHPGKLIKSSELTSISAVSLSLESRGSTAPSLIHVPRLLRHITLLFLEARFNLFKAFSGRTQPCLSTSRPPSDSMSTLTIWYLKTPATRLFECFSACSKTRSALDVRATL